MGRESRMTMKRNLTKKVPLIKIEKINYFNILSIKFKWDVNKPQILCYINVQTFAID